MCVFLCWVCVRKGEYMMYMMEWIGDWGKSPPSISSNWTSQNFLEKGGGVSCWHGICLASLGLLPHPQKKAKKVIWKRWQFGNPCYCLHMNYEFKNNEIKSELRGEPRNNYAVEIDGKTWKVFSSKFRADKAAWTISLRGSKTRVYVTGAMATA